MLKIPWAPKISNSDVLVVSDKYTTRKRQSHHKKRGNIRAYCSN